MANLVANSPITEDCIAECGSIKHPRMNGSGGVSSSPAVSLVA